jgi:hypothetical protein
MYEDALLLEVKSLNDNKNFESEMSHKIKLNLNLFYWIKNILINNLTIYFNNLII